MLPDQLAVAIFPLLIPAAAIPNSGLKRALTEPLAEKRDEVIYIHLRASAVARVQA